MKTRLSTPGQPQPRPTIVCGVGRRRRLSLAERALLFLLGLLLALGWYAHTITSVGWRLTVWHGRVMIDPCIREGLSDGDDPCR